MKKIFLTLSLLFFSYAATMLLKTTNMDTGLAFFFLFGVLFFFIFYKYDLAHSIYKQHKRMVQILLILVIAVIVTFESFILTSANTDPNQVSDQIDTVLVLGAGTKHDKPGAVLKERLDKALAYAKQHPNIDFIVSGGVGFGKTKPEGEVMKTYLVNHGIEPRRIKTDDKATSTYENLYYAEKLLKPNANLLIVTSDFHLFRTKMIASRLGIKAEGLGSSLRLSSVPQSHVREYFAIVKSFLFDR